MIPPRKKLDNKKLDFESLIQYQKDLRKELVQEGHVFIDYSFTSKEGYFFRLVLNHLRSNPKVLQDIIRIIQETNRKLSNKLFA